MPEDGRFVPRWRTLLDLHCGLLKNTISEIDNREIKAQHSPHFLAKQKERVTIHQIKEFVSHVPNLDFRLRVSFHSDDTPCSALESSRKRWILLFGYSYETFSQLDVIDRDRQDLTRSSTLELDAQCWRHAQTIPAPSNPLRSTVSCSQEEWEVSPTRRLLAMGSHCIIQERLARKDERRWWTSGKHS